MLQVITGLQAAGIEKIHLNEPMAPYTYWKIGGPADALIIPQTKEQLIKTIQLANEHEVPWFLLGRGSNLLVSDKGIRGLVIKLGETLDYARYEGNMIYAGAAYSLIRLSVMAGRKGLAGLEFAGGIPGSVGGAVYMNAGAHGSDMSRILMKTEVLLDNGEVVTMHNKDLQYAYRYSILQQVRGIVLEAVLELQPGDRDEIAEANAVHKQRRLMTQPLQLACAGSVFRNPPNQYAAQLIEGAGLKGKSVGGAKVSTLHANFIINTGQATATDVLTLIEQIKTIIQDKYQVELVPEVMMVGER